MAAVSGPPGTVRLNATVSRARVRDKMAGRVFWERPESGVAREEGDRPRPFLIFF
ncbi:MAG: hypothetical protein ACP5D7_12265 [Limnospira sp.]